MAGRVPIRRRCLLFKVIYIKKRQDTSEYIHMVHTYLHTYIVHRCGTITNHFVITTYKLIAVAVASPHIPLKLIKRRRKELELHNMYLHTMQFSFIVTLFGGNQKILCYIIRYTYPSRTHQRYELFLTPSRIPKVSGKNLVHFAVSKGSAASLFLLEASALLFVKVVGSASAIVEGIGKM